MLLTVGVREIFEIKIDSSYSRNTGATDADKIVPVQAM